MKKVNSPITKKIIGFFLIIVLTCMQACVPFFEGRKDFQSPPPSNPPNQIPRKDLPNQTPKKVTAKTFDLHSSFEVATQRIYKLLLANDLNSIEKIANQARDKKERIPGGYWKLDVVYEALTNVYSETKGQEVTDEMWKKRIELLKKWKETLPDSITARVALAEGYINYGWFARGFGYANTISSENAQLLDDRLQMAQKELLEANKLNRKCPRWYREMLFLGMANGWSSQEFEQIFEEAVNFEPNYLQFYLVKSEYLTPKWHGSQEQWQEFVDELPNKLAELKTDERSIIYFVVVVNKMRGERALEFNLTKLSKDLIINGFNDLDKKYQSDNLRLNQLAYISYLLEDFPSAQKAFERIGDDNDNTIWSKQAFINIKQKVQQEVIKTQDK